MSQRVLVIVESPLQLINANEYIRKYDLTLDSDYYFISSRGVNNLNQLKKTFEILKLEGNITEISVVDIDNSFLTRILFYMKVIKAAKKKNTIDYKTVLVGHMRSIYQAIFANTFKNGKCIYLDDGNSSISEQKTLREYKINSFSPWYKRIFPMIFGLSANLKFNNNYLHFFTMYKDVIIEDHKHLKFYYNEFNYLKKEYDKKQTNTEIIYFIGTPFYWQVASYNNFKNDMLKISKIYKNKKVIYFPHRYESQKQLDIIKSLHWKISTVNLPIELSLIKEENLPLEFGMFYSSASYSLSKLIPNLKFRSFEVNNTEYLEDGENIFKLYRAYEENKNIELVKL